MNIASLSVNVYKSSMQPVGLTGMVSGKVFCVVRYKCFKHLLLAVHDKMAVRPRISLPRIKLSRPMGRQPHPQKACNWLL